jgi:membrane-associated protease RseP (regulator of RpoE activity)
VDWLGWLIFLFVLLFSVLWHETGHFVMAKKFGMKATRYFVGFGPTLWSTRRGETEYGVKALPLGGFVKIIGMTSLDEVDPADEARSFRRAPGWQRVVVLVAGVAMNFVLAAVLIFALALAVGIENDNTTQLGTVAACVPANEQALSSDAPCTSRDAKSPATIAGLKVGDQITSFNGVKVTSWTQLANVIKDVKPGSTVSLTVQRSGRPLTLHTTLAAVKGRSGGYLGIAAATVFQSASPLGAIEYVGTGFSEEIGGTASDLGQLPGHLGQFFNKKDRAQSAAGNVVSLYGAARETGQAVAADVGWQYKISFVILIAAALNMILGTANLLPLLPMDGGHVAVVIWERTRAWFARLRGRADPGLADYRKFIPVSFSIFVVLCAFALVLVYADIVNPVNIG